MIPQPITWKYFLTGKNTPAVRVSETQIEANKKGMNNFEIHTYGLSNIGLG